MAPGEVTQSQQSSNLGRVLKRAIGIGPIIGSVIAGGVMYAPTHNFRTSLFTSVLMFLVLAGMRAADGILKPLWKVMAVIPRPLRAIVGIALPIWFAISRFGPEASGQEVARARSTMLIGTFLAYFLIRPRRADR
jgi:hypothetical protein